MSTVDATVDISTVSTVSTVVFIYVEEIKKEMNEELTNELHNFHTCLNSGWKVFKEYYQRIPMNDSDWDEVVRKMSDIFEASKPIGHAKDVIMFYLDTLEARDKKARAGK